MSDRHCKYAKLIIRGITNYSLEEHARDCDTCQADAEIERLEADNERLRADLALLKPVCSASSGGMVEGIMCPTCKGNGFVPKALAAVEDKE